MSVNAREVAIVGAGPAGCASAILLARAGFRVTLLERAQTPPAGYGETLPADALPLLRELGLGAIASPSSSTLEPIRARHSAWGSTALDTTDELRSPIGLGWHLRRQMFVEQLRDAVRDAHASLRLGISVNELKTHERGWSLHLTDGGTLDCAWLLDASGRASTIARRLGARRRIRDHQLAYVVLGSEGCPEAEPTTLVETVAEGWWYTSRCPGGAPVLTHFTDDALGERERDEVLRSRLAQTLHVRQRFGAHNLRNAKIVAVDARTSHLDRFVGRRWIALGDAALSVDPLSSSGLLFALDSAFAAADVVAAGAELGPAYAAHQFDRLARSIEVQRALHALERRWPTQPYWAARQEAVPGQSQFSA